jgi:hypothetical protein
MIEGLSCVCTTRRTPIIPRDGRYRPGGTGLASLDRGYGPKCVLRLAYSVRLCAPETGAPEQIGTPVRLVRNPA